MKNTFRFALLLVFNITLFSNPLFTQIIGFSECLDQNDAFIGLDRKGWTSNVNDVSESYQLDFQIPDPSPFDCHKVAYISVTIDVDVNFNNIMPPDCYIGFWTNTMYCDSNDPLGCDESTILADQMGLNNSYNIISGDNGNDIELENGGNIGIDVVVLTVSSNPSCDQTPISSGLYDADVEVCIEIYYEPLEPEMEVDLGDDIIICAGETIDLVAPSGFESYEWDGPIDNDEQTLENAGPGVYILDAYDDLGCKVSDEIEIIADNAIIIEFDSNNPLDICNGNSYDINPIINNIPNNVDFEYNWTFPDATTSNLSGIIINQIGTYTIEVEDSNSECTASAVLNVNNVDISLAQIDSISLNEVSICEGETLALSGFVPFDDNFSYAFEWINGLDTIRIQDINIQNSGTYILNMYNQLGCPPSSDTIEVNIITPQIAGAGNNTTICRDEILDLNTLLSLDASANGLWHDDNNSIITDGLFSSNDVGNIQNIIYVVLNTAPCVNDTSQFSVFINSGNVNAGNDIQSVICFESMIDLNLLIDGDQGGNFYDDSFTILNNSVIDASALNIGSNELFYILQGGTCGLDTAILNLDILPPILNTVIEGPFCNDYEVEIAGIIYNMNNPIGSATLLSTNNCDSIVDVSLMFYPVSDTLISRTYCADDVVIIGGEIFDINNNSDIITLMDASENGCDSIISVDLEFLDAIEFDITRELCDGDSIIIEGETYNSSNPIESIVLPNGSSLGCDSIININLTFTTTIVEIFETTLCEDETIDINGTIYSITNDSGQQNFMSSAGCDSILDISIEFLSNSDSMIIMDLCADDVFVLNGETFDESNPNGSQELINSLGCDSTIVIDLTFNPESINNISNILCSDESIIIEGEVFDIDNPNGVVTLDNQSQFQCDSIINIDLEFVDEIVTSIVSELCEGDSIFINNQWEFTSGNYVENLQTISMCDSTVNYEVNFSNCNIDIDFQILSGISCFNFSDASILFELSGMLNLPYDFEVLDLDNNASVTSGMFTSANLTLSDFMASDYLLNLFDINGNIISSQNFTIDNVDELMVMVSTDEILCLGDSDGSLSLNVTGGTSPYSYLWNDNSTSSTINQLESGNYSYTINDSNNCTLEGNIDIVSPMDLDAIINVSNADCFNIPNGEIEVTDVTGGTPDYNFSVGGYNFTSNNVFSNMSNGNYQVFITDMNDCIKDFNATVGIESMNTIDDIDALSILLGDSINLLINLDFTPVDINWNPATSISCDDCLFPTFYPTETTEYLLSVEDEFGCIIERSIIVNVEFPDFSEVYIPTVFNPNDQTGNNNLFRPFFHNDANIEFGFMTIYDRWGNKVYTEENELIGWDGRSNNRFVNQGVYVYLINYLDSSGKAQKLVGDITLIR